MDFIYLLRSLLKRKWLVLIASLIAASITFLFTQNTQKKYSSIAQVSTGFTISDKIKMGNENFDIYEADTKFNNAIVTLTSPSVISLLSYTLILHDLENSPPFRGLTEKEKTNEIHKQLNKEEAIKLFKDRLESMRLLTSYKPEEKNLIELLTLYGYDYKTIGKNLNVYRLQRTDYMQIEYISENPELSAFIVNGLYQQFIRYYKRIRSTTSQESIDTLKSLVEKKKLELDMKNSLLRGEGMVDIGIQNTSTYEMISNFEQSLSQEKTKLTTLYASLRKINQRLGDLGVQTTTTTLPKNNDELLILRKAVNDAYSEYLNSGSTDKTLLARYNQLKNEYQTKVATLNQTQPATTTTTRPTESKTELLQQKNDLEIDIQTSNANISSLQGKIGTLRGSVYKDASRGATVETLMKEAEQANNEYLLAKQKYNDAIDMSSSSVNNFRQILTGQPAIAPNPSKRLLIIGMAGLSAMIASILIIILLSYLDNTVKTPNIFAKAVNLKLISMVNFMNLKNTTLTEIIANSQTSEINIRQKNKHSVFRESIRKLRYEVEISGKKIFLFASTKKGQGKTTLIMALAYSLSMSKKKILIIDTNFSNNDLTIEMGADPILERIASASSGGKSLIEQIKANSKKVEDRNIFIIGSEGGDYTPSEILPRENILQHLQELTNEFDYIFLEGPPLNDFSDAKELSQFVDGVIGVFSANDIIKQIDKESISFFRELKGKYIGSILNMVDLENVNVV